MDHIDQQRQTPGDPGPDGLGHNDRKDQTKRYSELAAKVRRSCRLLRAGPVLVATAHDNPSTSSADSASWSRCSARDRATPEARSNDAAASTRAVRRSGSASENHEARPSDRKSVE